MTRKIFYAEPEKTTLKTALLKIRHREEKTALAFPETIFFPAGGGQPADRGSIQGEGWAMSVDTVEENEDHVWHWGVIKGRDPEPGETVEMHLDEVWRSMICAQHTAQHLFSAVLEKYYALPTTGFSILTDWVKIEVPRLGELSPTLVAEAEEQVRFYIVQRLPVYTYWKNPQQRIVEIPNLDVNPCGGLHVRDTGYIGGFTVLRYYRKNRHFWRIEFVAGRKLEETLRETTRTVDALHALLGQNLIEAVQRQIEKQEELEKQVQRLKEELLNARAELLSYQVEEKESRKILVQSLPYAMEELRMLARNLGELGISCVLLNEKGQVVLVSSFPSWGEKVIALLNEHGFRGTSTPHFAQGKIERVTSFLHSVREISKHQ